MISAAFKRVQIARTALLLDQPFFGVLALGLELVEDTTCQTAWTDGRSLGFNPTFVEKLSHDELLAVVAHEVMHCACGHPWRRQSREPRKWNVAADYAINSVIAEAGFQLPAGCLLDPQFAGKWAEWIYDRIPDSPQGSGQGQGQGQSASGNSQTDDPSGLGEVRDAPSDADAPTEADWQQQKEQAIKQSRGKLPASLKRDIQSAGFHPADWRSLLRRYVSEVCKADYSWLRPNVRYLASGLYLPALHAHRMGAMVVAVDTSGSIDSVTLGQFANEVTAIANDVQPSEITVMYCDAKVHRVDTFAAGDAIALQPCGGGGTAFEPVFDRIAADGELPAVLVYLTDLYGSFPDVAPDYPVIWAVTSSVADVSFGDVVPIT